MPSFSKDKASNKWFCSDCGEEIPMDIIKANYNYFGESKEHICLAREEKNKKVLSTK